jgi:hypothetical protein
MNTRLITKTDRLAARWRPSNCTETIETPLGVIYHSPDKSQGIAYKGTAGRSDWHYTFKTAEGFDAQAKEWFSKLELWAKYRADQRVIRKTANTPLEVWEKARTKAGESGAYLSGPETAVLIRSVLAKKFPGNKFSVRCSRGSSINVRYTGPAEIKAVEEILYQYEGADFDGTIDLKTSRYCWLYRDGSASLAINHGTHGSGGVILETIGSPLSGDAVLVHFGSNYIFVDKEKSK